MDKDFVGGKVEVKEFDGGGEIIKIWIPKDEVMRILKDSGINVDIKTGKASGKLYMENNTWQPTQPKQPYPQRDQEQGNPEFGGHADQIPDFNTNENSTTFSR